MRNDNEVIPHISQICGTEVSLADANTGHSFFFFFDWAGRLTLLQRIHSAYSKPYRLGDYPLTCTMRIKVHLKTMRSSIPMKNHLVIAMLNCN